MRWIVGSVLAVIAVWGFYVSSPYYALVRLAQAVESGNVAEVAARVNVRALRYSLAKQVASEFAAAESGTGLATADAQFAAGTALALADPVLDALVTPEGLVRLLRTSPSGVSSGTAFGRGRISLGDVDDFLSASTWRGFRNVYVLLPPGEPAERRFRLQLRLGQLRWRVVSLDLPPALRQRISDDVRRRFNR